MCYPIADDPVAVRDYEPAEADGLAWHGADRPEYGIGRPGGRARRLLVAAYASFVLSGVISLSAQDVATSRHVGDQPVGAVTIRGLDAVAGLQLESPPGS